MNAYGGIWIGRKKLCVVLGLITLCIAVMIFLFSAQNGELSADTSSGFTNFVIRLLSSQYDLMSKVEQDAIYSFADHLVRKIGHFGEYLLLGLFLRLWLETLLRSHASSIAWGLCTLYSVTDEFHQMFVDARASSVVDVMIDSAGALAGVVCAFSIILLIWRYKIRKELKNAEINALVIDKQAGGTTL